MDDTKVYLAGLGTLARLPFELRSLIWDFVTGDIPTHRRKLPASNDLCASLNERVRLKYDLDEVCVLCKDDIKTCNKALDSIFAASDDIFDEVARALHKKQIARFVLPTFGNARSPSYVAVYRSNSLIARLHHAYLDFDGYHVASRQELEHFISIPWNLFKTIRIEMEAPRDAADVIRLWSHIICICDALFMVKRLPAIEICPYNSRDGTRTWGTDGIPNKSIPWPAFFEKNSRLLDTLVPISDLELLLSPFRRLTGARSAKVCLPPGISDDRLQHYVQLVETLITEEQMYRHWYNYSELTNWILQEEDERTLILEAILDDLDGPNAQMVRLQRFMTWNKHYFRNMNYRNLGDAHKKFPSGAWPIRGYGRQGIHMDLRNWLSSACIERCLGWQAFRQAWPDRVDQSMFETVEQDLEQYGLGKLGSAIYACTDDPEDEPFNLCIPDWGAYYPAGIPRKSSEEYSSRIEEYVKWKAVY